MKTKVSFAICGLALVVASAAQASVDCHIYAPSSPSRPRIKDKEIAHTLVKASPSADPTDARRHTYLIVKEDASSAATVTIQEVKRMQIDGVGSEIGNYLVDLQETVSRGLYAIQIFTLDEDGLWAQGDSENADALGSVGPRRPLALEVPALGFAVLCKQN